LLLGSRTFEVEEKPHLRPAPSLHPSPQSVDLQCTDRPPVARRRTLHHGRQPQRMRAIHHLRATPRSAGGGLPPLAAAQAVALTEDLGYRDGRGGVEDPRIGAVTRVVHFNRHLLPAVNSDQVRDLEDQRRPQAKQLLLRVGVQVRCSLLRPSHADQRVEDTLRKRCQQRALGRRDEAVKRHSKPPSREEGERSLARGKKARVG
ncbi:hypothetical protein T484DRAFT_1923908, partial [Baffinella frigidus]